MDALTFDILQSAVNIARIEQVRRLDTLRVKLAVAFPGMEDQCNAAISAWASYVHERNPNGVSRFD